MNVVYTGDLVGVDKRIAYSLCRRPEHHTCSDMARGFSYLNSLAVLAETLQVRGADRVAILDVDILYDNGTRDIVSERADVLTVSVHAYPNDYPVFYRGNSDRVDRGEGRGFSPNLPLTYGDGDEALVITINAGLTQMNAFGADLLLVALGLYAHRGDPPSVLSITTDGFRRAGDAVGAFVGRIRIPQDGGYACPELRETPTTFLEEADD